MAKRKDRVGSKAWWDKELKKPDPVLENKAFKYKSSSYRKPEYGKTEYYQKGEDGKFRYSEDYIPVKGAMEKREDVTYVPIAKRFDRETGEFKAPPVKETKVEPKATSEPEPVKTTTSSNSGEDGVRELWTDKGQIAPPDLKAWVKRGRKEDGIWRYSKDNVTVLYSKDKGFALQYQNDNTSGSSGSDWGDEP